MRPGCWLRSRRNDEFAVVESVGEHWVVIRPVDSLEVHYCRPQEVKRDWYLFRRLRSFEKDPLPAWAVVGAIVANDEDFARYEIIEVKFNAWALLRMLGLPEGRHYYMVKWMPFFSEEFRPVRTRFERV